MASSAAASAFSSTLPINKTCMYCRVPSALLKPGWRLSSGGYALLCDRCASAYKEGRFCNIFHLDDDGWRDCITCKKYVHCGCIMSAPTYIVLYDRDGIRCANCMSNDIPVGTESFNMSTKNSPRRTRRDMQGSLEVRPSVHSDKKINERTPGTPSQKDAPSTKSSSNRYTPRATEEEPKNIQKDANSVVVSLFEKTMTVSDADPKKGRLVVPKKCAMDYLPKLSEPQGFPIRIQDTGGKDWEFHFRFWPNKNSTVYVLEGINDYLISNQCEAGDKVTFYQVDPKGKLVIGMKKRTQPNISDRKKSLRSFGKIAKKRTSGS